MLSFFSLFIHLVLKEFKCLSLSKIHSRSLSQVSVRKLYIVHNFYFDLIWNGIYLNPILIIEFVGQMSFVFPRESHFAPFLEVLH